MELEIRHTTEDKYDVLAPQGELDLASYTLLSDRITELIRAGRADIVVDLAGTEFLDSTALGALIGGRRNTHAAGGSFAVVCDKPQLLKLFRITRLDESLNVLPSLETWRESVGI